MTLSSRHPHLLLNQDGPIWTVTLNRPEKLNALTLDLWRELGRVAQALSDDEAVRCIVLRGAGERAFSPGNDIAEFATTRANATQARAYGTVMHATLATLRDCRAPIVAQIHGVCVGGGMEIAALADVRICGDGARFGAPIKNLGLTMAHAELAPLIERIGAAALLALLLEGRIIDAHEALRLGLVTRVVPDAEVATQAQASARAIAAGAPRVARWHKQFVRQILSNQPLSETEHDAAYACFDTKDFHVGYQAFLAKQIPQFSGR